MPGVSERDKIEGERAAQRAYHYLGVDAGGTKTHALIATRDGQIVGIGYSGCGNWENVGLEGAYLAVMQALAQALQQAALEPGDLCAAGYGMAGMDWSGDQPRLAPLIERLGIPGPAVLVNDAYSALSAGSRSGDGVAVIAGTGTVVVGRNRRGEHFRTFGLGPMFGDFGAAGNIVEAAIRAASFAYIGRGQPTALSDRIAAYYGVKDIVEFAEQCSRDRRFTWPDGRMAPLVFETAALGDHVAQDILRMAGNELGQNAVAVVRKLALCDESFDLVLAGGVFRSKSEIFIDAVLAPVRAHAPFVSPVTLQAPPVVGSVLLAMQAAGVPITSALRDRLLAQAVVQFAL